MRIFPRPPAILLLPLCLAQAALAVFTDVTEEALGLPPGQVPGAVTVALPDINADGWPDLYLSPWYIYLNEGDGSFSTRDASDISGVLNYSGEHRASFADADNDGDMDMVLASHNITVPGADQHCFYFENQGAPEFQFEGEIIWTFLEYVRAGQPVFLDGDGDGDCEIYAAMFGNWDPYAIGTDQYFVMDDEGQWQNEASTWITQLQLPLYRRPTRGCVAADYDNDFDLDIFVPAYGISWNESWHNMLWRNDGLLDLCVANIHGWAALYHNDGDGGFSNVTEGSGLPTYGPEKQWHDAAWADLDLLLTQWYGHEGFVDYLYRNDAPENPGHFSEVAEELGFDTGGNFRDLAGQAFADYDRDGDLDFFFYSGANNGTAGVYVYRNDLDEQGLQNHWLVLDLAGNGTTCSRTPGGTQVQVFFRDGSAGGVRQVETTSSDQSMNMHPVHLGLGGRDEIQEIRVRWLDGSVEYWRGGDQLRMFCWYSAVMPMERILPQSW